MQRRGRPDELGNLISLWSVGEIVEEPLAATGSVGAYARCISSTRPARRYC